MRVSDGCEGLWGFVMFVRVCDDCERVCDGCEGL